MLPGASFVFILPPTEYVLPALTVDLLSNKGALGGTSGEVAVPVTEKVMYNLYYICYSSNISFLVLLFIRL